MSLATDILKRSGLAPLSPIAKTRIHKRRRNALYPEIQARRKAVRACGFQNGKAVNLGEFKTQERAAIANRLFNYWKSQLSLIGYLITGNRSDTMIFRLNRRDDNTSGVINKPLLR